MKRYSTMAKVAGTISFLASDAAGNITGQNIRIDGGLMRGVSPTAARITMLGCA